MLKQMRRVAPHLARMAPVAALLVSAGAWAVDPPEDGKGPQARTGQMEPADREERVQADSEERFSPETARVDDLTPDWDGYGIKQVLASQQAAWNRGDIDAFMEGYWKSDDLRFASGGTITKGWQATIDRYKKRYSSREKMGTLKFSDLDVNVLSGDAALVFGRWTLERKEDKPTGLFTLLFRKVEDKWVIVHDHTSAE